MTTQISKKSLKIIENPKTSIIKRLEDSKKPFFQIIALFVLIIIVRIFLEVIETKITLSPELFTHYFLWFVMIALNFIIIFAIVTKETLKKISKVVLPFFAIILLPILIDFVATFGNGAKICYLKIPDAQNWLFNFVTMGGTVKDCGITLGMKLEISLILIFSAYYIYTKTKAPFKTIATTFLLYVCLFIHSNTPFIINSIISLFGGAFESPLRAQLLIAAILILILIEIKIIFLIKRKVLLFAIAKDISLLRVAHFLGIFIFGIVIALKFGNSLLLDNIFSTILFGAGLVCAVIFSTIQNNVADAKIDSFLNKNRALQDGKVKLREYFLASFVFLFFSLAFAALAGFYSAIIMLILLAIYAAYSTQPLRLKRIPIFSKLLISISTVLCLLEGFVLAGGALELFPLNLIVLIIVGFTLAINFIDIKDYEGDKKEGIKTLPVLLGLAKSKFLIATFFVFAYALAYFVLNKLFLLPLIALFALLEFFLITKKNYDERFVFLVYLISLLILGFFYIS